MNIDDRIREGLNNAPASPPRPINDLQRRARTIHNRRRAATTGVVLVTAAAVALPFALTGSGSSVDAVPAVATADSRPEPDAEETTPCDSWSGSGHPLEIDEVPDHVRLLWDENIAQPPSGAWASDKSEMTVDSRAPEGCVIRDGGTESLALMETDADMVARKINIFRPSELPNATLDSLAERTLPTNSGEMMVRDDEGRITAVWPDAAKGHWMMAVVGGISDAELVELAQSVRLVEGEIDASRWSGYSRATIKEQSDDPLGDGIRVQVQMSGRLNLFIESDQSSVDLWRSATVDDRQVNINGRDGLLNAANGYISFLTGDGALVRMTSRFLDASELLGIARSIEPVPADDPRLIEVWQTEFDESAD